jgi:hypothetical protein
VKVAYTYIADGTKAGAVDSAGKGFDYLGSLVYTNENNVKQTRLNYVYFPNSKRLYHINYKGPAFIRNIKNNYKQFFFGTLK